MSRISMEQVKHVAHLARLAITEEEAEAIPTSTRSNDFICRAIK